LILHHPRNDEENRQIAAWVGAELGVTFAPPFFAVASLDHRGVIIGAVVLNNYDAANIDLTAAGEGAFTPSVVRQVCSFVFDHLGCVRITAKTRRSNHRVRKLLKKHAVFEAMLRNWFGDEDAFQFRMCRDECRFLRTQNGFKPVSSKAA
jgi:RimJ/RimL family protein N-acetyltransferase